jgi:hypothetical protein
MERRRNKKRLEESLDASNESSRALEDIGEKLRDENETIFDALCSEEADFTGSPYADEIIETIREYEG